MSRLIGLVGKARVGKDTVADHLQVHHRLARYAFADPIKDMLETVFGDRFRGEDRETPLWWLGKSPRHLMQTLGTEWGRQNVHPDLWVLLAEQVWNLSNARGEPGLVISDVRFDNEVEMVRRQGGRLIEIVRPDAPSINDHVSEDSITCRQGFITIVNDGTIEQLLDKVDAALEVEVGH